MRCCKMVSRGISHILQQPELPIGTVHYQYRWCHKCNSRVHGLRRNHILSRRVCNSMFKYKLCRRLKGNRDRQFNCNWWVHNLWQGFVVRGWPVTILLGHELSGRQVCRLSRCILCHGWMHQLCNGVVVLGWNYNYMSSDGVPGRVDSHQGGSCERDRRVQDVHAG